MRFAAKCKTLSEHGYQYKKILGNGSFSCVLLCQSTKYNQDFAIKRAIQHHITEDEYNYLVALNHPHIINIYDSFYDEEAQYLVFDYCSNGTIQERGKLSFEQFVHYAKQILEAIAFCHSRNIAHRDIKPENIFFDHYDSAKLADFGMAKQFQNDEKSSQKYGSLLFCPPEMFQYQEICPFKADIWALGITFFFMASGKYPFKSKSKEELQQLIVKAELNFSKYDINPKIRALLIKMLCKDQNNRPTAERLLESSMFSNKSTILKSKSAMRIALSTFHTHPGIHLNKSMTFESQSTDAEEYDIEQHHEHRSAILTYQSCHPKNQRINGRLQHGKLMIYFFAAFCSSLIPIPKKPSGIKIGPSSAPISFEVFTDITCPDCAADYNNIQLLLAEYPTQINFVFHFFEIPAHTWSYLLTRSIYACYKESEDNAKKILDGLFGKYEQAKFYPKALSNVGEVEVLELAKEYMISKTGIDKKTFELNYDDVEVIQKARVDFKYSFIRNLNSIPTIYVNGVKSDLGVSSSLKDWKDLINSLLE